MFFEILFTKSEFKAQHRIEKSANKVYNSLHFLYFVGIVENTAGKTIDTLTERR